MASLQPFNRYQSGSLATWDKSSPNASPTFNYFPSASFREWITTSGYTGSKPKPLVPHGYSLQKVQYSQSGSGQRKDGLSGWSGPRGRSGSNVGYFANNLKNSNDVAVLDNATLSKLNEAVRGGLDLSVDIAEAGQTARMLKVNSQISDNFNVFRRRFGLLKLPANLWLQWTYGVKPLLSDLHDAAEESLRMVINKTQRFTVQKTISAPIESCTIDNYANGIDTFATPGATLKLSRKYSVILDTSGNNIDRFTSLNPISLAWETLPYSFVVDWFYDIGSYIRDFETGLLYSNKFVSGYTTLFWAWDYSYAASGRATSDPLSWNWSITGKCSGFNISRSVLMSYPLPDRPKFKADLGSSRLLSTAALLSTGLSSLAEKAPRGLGDAVQRGVGKPLSRRRDSQARSDYNRTR